MALPCMSQSLTSGAALRWYLHCIVWLLFIMLAAGNNPEVLTSFHFQSMSSFLVAQFLLLVPKGSIFLKYYINKCLIYYILSHYRLIETWLSQLSWIFRLESPNWMPEFRNEVYPIMSPSRDLFARDIQISPSKYQQLFTNKHSHFWICPIFSKMSDWYSITNSFGTSYGTAFLHHSQKTSNSYNFLAMHSKQFCNHILKWSLQYMTEIGLTMVVVKRIRAVSHESIWLSFRNTLSHQCTELLLFLYLIGNKQQISYTGL